jgi:RNA polymerase sigma-70 factor, ECF subfamily
MCSPAVTIGEDFAAVLAAARLGEQWAWAVIYRDLAGPVTGYLRGRGAVEPDDAASETFLQVARGLDSFTGDERGFRSWVFVIAHRRLADDLRASGRRPVPVADEFLTLASDVGAISLGDAVAEALSSDQVEWLLEPLTDDQRDVLLLRVVAGLSVSEASRVMGKSEGAIRVLQHRAVGALRRRMADGP